MEISHLRLLLAEFVFLALSYHAFDEQYEKMHLIVTEKSEYIYTSLQN